MIGLITLPDCTLMGLDRIEFSTYLTGLKDDENKKCIIALGAGRDDDPVIGDVAVRKPEGNSALAKRGAWIGG